MGTDEVPIQFIFMGCSLTPFSILMACPACIDDNFYLKGEELSKSSDLCPEEDRQSEWDRHFSHNRIGEDQSASPRGKHDHL